MRAVLGIDAAWTPFNPSGVAAAVETQKGWSLVAAVESYRRFHELAGIAPTLTHSPNENVPDPINLIASAEKLAGGRIDLVGIDMPLSYEPISGRRCSDNAVSTAYGARQCGTHTPNTQRPGVLSETLRIGFERAGYPLCTDKIRSPGLVEVYPHPALVELSNSARRLPYKWAKIRQYWPSLTVSERRENIISQWSQIVALLEHKLAGVTEALPLPTLQTCGAAMKGFEDALDAAICAWTAICCLEDRAKSYGDRVSAIWIPNATSLSPLAPTGNETE